MSEQDTQATISEAEVIDFLREKRDFFQRNDDLLADLKIPHPTGGQAISLLERQAEVLRDRSSEMKRRLQHLAQNARTNELLLERIQALILRLISCSDFNDAVQQLDLALRDEFHADFVTLKFLPEHDDSNVTLIDEQDLSLFEKFLNKKQPVCGYLSPEQRTILFGEHGDEVASAVLIPLCESQCDACLGMLAIGSVDPKRFHPEMGTIFVQHLGAIVTRILRSHLNS